MNVSLLGPSVNHSSLLTYGGAKVSAVSSWDMLISRGGEVADEAYVVDLEEFATINVRTGVRKADDT